MGKLSIVNTQENTQTSYRNCAVMKLRSFFHLFRIAVGAVRPVGSRHSACLEHLVQPFHLVHCRGLVDGLSDGLLLLLAQPSLCLVLQQPLPRNKGVGYRPPPLLHRLHQLLALLGTEQFGGRLPRMRWKSSTRNCGILLMR